MKNLRAQAQCFAETFSADRHNHELLKIDVVVGMRATIDDVHHRHRQSAGVLAAEIPI